MLRSILLACVPALCFSALAAAEERWTIVTADFQSRPVATVVSIDESGIQFTATAPGAAATATATAAPTSGGQSEKISWDSLLELDHSQTAAPEIKRGEFTLYLNGGDAISGAPSSIADDSVSWQHATVGRVDIPEDRVNAMVRAGQSTIGLDQPRKADIVRLLNGDQTTGVLQSLTDTTVTIHPADADASAQIGMDKVAAILLADADPTAAPTGRAWRVWLTDGSSFTVPVAVLAPGGMLAVGFSREHTTPIAAAALASIEPTSGPVRWLTSLAPSEVVYHPFLDENFPPGFDHPVDDPAATIRGAFPPFHHGIGVHSYTKLTYAVPDGFTSFRSQFAIERISGSDMTKADVNLRILLDGVPAAQFAHERFGDVAAPVMIDVSGKKELSLEVGDGDELNAQGRFVWLDPAFLKPIPTTQPAR